jgi:hypothetical protein
VDQAFHGRPATLNLAAQCDVSRTKIPLEGGLKSDITSMAHFGGPGFEPLDQLLSRSCGGLICPVCRARFGRREAGQIVAPLARRLVISVQHVRIRE